MLKFSHGHAPPPPTYISLQATLLELVRVQVVNYIDNSRWIICNPSSSCFELEKQSRASSLDAKHKSLLTTLAHAIWGISCGKTTLWPPAMVQSKISQPNYEKSCLLDGMNWPKDLLSFSITHTFILRHSVFRIEMDSCHLNHHKISSIWKSYQICSSRLL